MGLTPRVVDYQEVWPRASGSWSVSLRVDGELDGVLAVRVEDARNTGLYFVRNPDELTHVEPGTPLTLQ